MDMYDISKAEAVKHNGVVIGYLFPLNEEMWLPLSVLGKPLGPPSYKKDAMTTLFSPDRL